MTRKSYSELKCLKTYEERFKYLLLKGNVGKETFGFDRYLNQEFYNKSIDWKHIRNRVIVRDNGCDLGVPGHEISGRIYIHHINPLKPEDIINSSDELFNLENLICVSFETHNAIHYGNVSYLEKYQLTERTKNDTCPWKK